MTSSPSIQLFPDTGFISFGFNSGVPVGGGEQKVRGRQTARERRETQGWKEEKIEKGLGRWLSRLSACYTSFRTGVRSLAPT